MQGTVLSLLVVTLFVMGLSGMFSTTNAQSTISCCLTKKGKLKNCEFGEIPRRECRKNQRLIMLPGTSKTDELMDDVSSLKTKSQELMNKDTELINDLSALQSKDSDLMETDTELTSEVQALQTKTQELMSTVDDMQAQIENLKELVARALCGNGELDPGEQCDEGPSNGPERICAASCEWNCPCPFSLPFSIWSDEAPVRFAALAEIQGDNCALDSSDGQPRLVVTGSSCLALGEPPETKFVVIQIGQLEPAQVEACTLAMQAYVAELNDDENVTVEGGPPYHCSISQ